MINKKHLVKVTIWWTTIVYTLCFLGVSLFPGLRESFLRNALHLNGTGAQSITTFETFISGLLIWNVVAVLAFWLFATLFNSIKK